ncbi:unnamed protein product [Rotaria sordida]|uniref:Phosphoglycerate mutase n=1 Tax=Rotaria sordida TaxID=392033 RepID=A0A813PQ07_9BILA|nr:unnamed protein product [Rotaria sordida]CAF0756063.1 unnamed protein product [Rotaria sordida]CAF0775061.1 unnamed protein product [Rotaria sordida]CAF3828620.1 unnamed protein product [Rotaria sordida]
MYTNDYLTSDESGYYSSTSNRNDACLRFIIIRHGERVDNTYGLGWTRHAFNPAGQYYAFDANMPPTLPSRINWLEYELDTPLTLNGLQQSWNVGNILAQQNIPIIACYSSPAIRSIQTADQILGGLGQKMHIPIRLELGLFECSSWYAQLPINFMSYMELINSGFNIDTQYRSHLDNLPPLENEYEYYKRSKETMKKLIKLYKKRGGTILIVAHAPSLEVLTRHLMDEPPRPAQLFDLAGQVNYCGMTIVDRDPFSKSWQFRYSFDEQVNRQQQFNNALYSSATVNYRPRPLFSNLT